MSFHLCLGCVHIGYESATFWQSEYSSGGENDYFHCRKKHWTAELGYSLDEARLEECLLLASTCPDFQERVS